VEEFCLIIFQHFDNGRCLIGVLSIRIFFHFGFNIRINKHSNNTLIDTWKTHNLLTNIRGDEFSLTDNLLPNPDLSGQENKYVGGRVTFSSKSSHLCC
jgi:hypothetical protein